MTNNNTLDRLFKDFKVFIDTSSLMIENQETVENLFSEIAEVSARHNNKLIVSLTVIKDLEKFLTHENPGISARAKSALAILHDHKTCYDVHGDRDDAFSDSVFLKVFQQHRLDYNLALITQDHLLGKDILHIAKQNNAGKDAKLIEVYTVDGNGNLIPLSE
ncbi:hypothetical protein [Succinimonas sp.]|uniref:hypothetical protein n=1 Tax=Succinimonas sp. TaxID=1936151 RepID=UPI00386E17EB